MPSEVTAIVMIRTLFEIAGLFMLAQGILWMLGPRMREGNFFYEMVKRGNAPIYNAVRKIAPKLIRDHYIGIVTFILIVWIWLALGLWKQYACGGIAQCA